MKKFAVSCACFLLICLAGAMWFRNENSGKIAENEKNSSAQLLPESKCAEVRAAENKEETPKSEGYFLKEHNGSIAVFEQGKATPFKITSIAVNELPPADQVLLKSGIKVETEEKLNDVLEDYCS